jgi:hypothetical protein
MGAVVRDGHGINDRKGARVELAGVAREFIKHKDKSGKSKAGKEIGVPNMKKSKASRIGNVHNHIRFFVMEC